MGSHFQQTGLQLFFVCYGGNLQRVRAGHRLLHPAPTLTRGGRTSSQPAGRYRRRRLVRVSRRGGIPKSEREQRGGEGLCGRSSELARRTCHQSGATEISVASATAEAHSRPTDHPPTPPWRPLRLPHPPAAAPPTIVAHCPFATSEITVPPWPPSSTAARHPPLRRPPPPAPPPPPSPPAHRG